MKALIVGSGFLSRNDLDIFCDREYFNYLKSKDDRWKLIQSDTLGEHYVNKRIYRLPVEISFSDDENHSINLLLDEYYPIPGYSIDDSWHRLPSASAYHQFLLKYSHRFKRDCRNFVKTRNDILTRMAPKSPNYNSELISIIEKDRIYQKRIKETYYYDHPNLNVSKKEFFNESVNYIYDHDSLHEIVKLYDKPCYSYAKTDEKEVFLSKKLFNAMDRKYQVGCVLEESYVLALERHQIPNHFRPDPKKSFEIALQKICTSITSGWFREFAWQNYDNVLMEYNADYVEKFKITKMEGKLKYHEKEKV